MPGSPPLYHEVTGVIHCHSTYSDGAEPVPVVVEAAQRAGLDYLLMTDHNTVDYLTEIGEGWHGRTLLLLGIEVSPYRSHYLAYGVERAPDEGLPLQEFMDDVREQGGIGFIAHPFDTGSPFLGVERYHWEDWNVERFHGIELWNWISEWAGTCTNPWRTLRALLDWRFAARGPAPLALKTWDKLGQNRRLVGIGGVDAHGIKKRFLGVDLVVHPYARSFRTVRTHLLLQEPLTGEVAQDRIKVMGALREGRCYIANWLEGDPTGFAFSAAIAGEGWASMGEECPWVDGTSLAVRAPVRGQIRILKDGRPVAEGAETLLEAAAEGPGVYRAEVWRGERGWIFSNPIYLRG